MDFLTSCGLNHYSIHYIISLGEGNPMNCISLALVREFFLQHQHCRGHSVTRSHGKYCFNYASTHWWSEDEVMRTVVPVCSVSSVETSGLSLLETFSTRLSLYCPQSITDIHYYNGIIITDIICIWILYCI